MNTRYKGILEPKEKWCKVKVTVQQTSWSEAAKDVWGFIILKVTRALWTTNSKQHYWSAPCWPKCVAPWFPTIQAFPVHLLLFVCAKIDMKINGKKKMEKCLEKLPLITGWQSLASYLNHMHKVTGSYMNSPNLSVCMCVCTVVLSQTKKVFMGWWHSNYR